MLSVLAGGKLEWLLNCIQERSLTFISREFSVFPSINNIKPISQLLLLQQPGLFRDETRSKSIFVI